MKNIEEIRSMSTDELEAESSRLYRKLAKRVFVYPALIAVAGYVVVSVIDRKSSSTATSE